MAKKKSPRLSTKYSVPEPPRSRPSFAKGYGIKAGDKGMIAWADACAQIARSHNYWISTTRPDGRPHVMPIWGIWHDGALIFGTDRNSQKGVNLQANPRATVHLESGADVVMLEGTAREITGENAIAAIDAAYQKKYKMKLTDAPCTPYILAVAPRVVFAWRERDFPKSATRWKF
jgi:pyridoxine/pyridoxamine 5'-phosphate oxidase